MTIISRASFKRSPKASWNSTTGPSLSTGRITVPTVMITGAVARAAIGRTMVPGIMRAAGITGAVVAANVTTGEELEEAATTGRAAAIPITGTITAISRKGIDHFLS